MARLLINEGYKVSTYLFNIASHLSEDCVTSRQRLLDSKYTKDFVEVTAKFDPPESIANTLMIGDLFGFGLSKPLAGGLASLAKYINQSPTKIAGTDVPSDLIVEDNTYDIHANIIHTALILALHERKLSLLFADAQQLIGRLKVFDIRLNQEFIQRTEAQYYLLEENDTRSRLLHRDDFSHKGDMGNTLITAGSYSMSGAVILVTRVCLHGGMDKVTVYTSKRDYNIMQIFVPEAILQMDHGGTAFTKAVDTGNPDASAISPGLDR